MVLGLLALGGLPAAAAEPVRVYAAGSLVAPLKELIAASGLDEGTVADPVFGAAGLLRQRLEAGEAADLFLSADLAQPRRLVETGRAGLVVPFARNSLCVLTRESLGITPDNLLAKLLTPDLRLATSTPSADPGGDYAIAVFARAEALQPGAGGQLTRKAQHLLGAPNAMVPVAGRSPSASIFLADRADALLYYCSGQGSTLREVPGLTLVRLPPALAVPATYSLALLSDRPVAMRLALFVLSERGQAILARHDLLPLASPLP